MTRHGRPSSAGAMAPVRSGVEQSTMSAAAPGPRSASPAVGENRPAKSSISGRSNGPAESSSVGVPSRPASAAIASCEAMQSPSGSLCPATTSRRRPAMNRRTSAASLMRVPPRSSRRAWAGPPVTSSRPPRTMRVDLGAHPEPLEVDARLDREARALAQPSAIGELDAVEVHPVAVHPGADRMAGPVTQARREAPGGDHVAGRPIHVGARRCPRRVPSPIAATAASRAATTAANTRSCSASGRGASTPTQEMSANTDALARLAGPQVELDHLAPREPPAPPDGLVVRIGARLPRGDEHRAVGHQPGARDEPGDPLLHVRLVHGPAVGERRTGSGSRCRCTTPCSASAALPVRGLRVRVERAEAVHDEVLGRRQRGGRARSSRRAVPWSRKEITGKDSENCAATRARGGSAATTAATSSSREVQRTSRPGRCSRMPGSIACTIRVGSPVRRQDPGPRPAVVRPRAARRARGRRSRRGGTGYKKAIRRGRPPGWPERCARRPAWRCSARNPSAVPARRTAR